MLDNVYEATDGLKLTWEQSCDIIRQEIMYNGWKNDHYLSDVFIFAPCEVAIAWMINAPGVMNDSTIAEGGNLY